VVHDPARYGRIDRVRVVTVVEGSPAAMAGLRVGDQINAVNADVLNATDPADGSSTLPSADRIKAILGAATRLGEITLRVSNGGRHRDVRFTPATGCDSDVRLVPGGEVNAWADGDRVTVTDAMIAKCETDDELALVVGHELAHNLLHHRTRLASAEPSGSRLLPVSAASLAENRMAEEEADRLAVQLARRAAYDLSGAVTFLGGLLAADGLSGRAATTHPRAHRRLALLKAAIARAERPAL
jgi:hypothetical protein